MYFRQKKDDLTIGKHSHFPRTFITIGAFLGGIFYAMKRVMEWKREDGGIDKDNPYLHPLKKEIEVKVCENMYEERVKPAMDRLLSFVGLILLFPLYVLISIAVYLDDPGPVFFSQKRVGRDKHFFMLHKYRTMKISAPHDVPTHRLSDSEQYITRVGKFLRKTSLDELPQIWDIFRGKMSIIGPRPALWNQADLIEFRERYGVNSVTPGLTGLAQIKGRDKLSIQDKAKIDGDYTRRLRAGGLTAFRQDTACFVKTIGSVLKHKGVVEGGSKGFDCADLTDKRRLGAKKADDASIELKNYGFKKYFDIDCSKRKRILITGSGSYVGESLIEYAKEHYPRIAIDVIDMENDTWEEYDFTSYDTIFHVAGIAHADVGKIARGEKAKYYTVNRDLAIATAKKSKASGVKQFIFMSSMIIYGDSAPCSRQKIINEYSVPSPSNFYGDSKLQGDIGVQRLSSPDFRVAVIRSPMIYGRNSKGNYLTLTKIAKRVCVVPEIKNQRSMIYIDNLCEFVCKLILSGEGGIYFPQNTEYVKTYEIIKEIRRAVGKTTKTSELLNPIVRFTSHIPGRVGKIVNKAFGNNIYDQKLSQYDGLEYRVITFAESIERIQRPDTALNVDVQARKSALIVASVASMIDQFNIPNIKLLINLGYDVDVATNFVDGSTCTDEKIKDLLWKLDELKVDCYQVDFVRKAMDVKANVKAFKQLNGVVCNLAKPVNGIKHHSAKLGDKYNIIHSHSPVGGVLGRLVAKKNGIKTIYTAHGFHFFSGAPKKNWMFFYPIEWGLSWITDILITINHEDYERARRRFHAKRVVYIPGVGVDTKKFSSGLIDPEEKRKEMGVSSDTIMLLSVGELTERKNHKIVIKALAKLANPNIHYYIAGTGKMENDLKELVYSFGLDDQVLFLGFRTDISELCQAADIFVFPSRQEGLPLALMEAIACETPVICSDIRGNRDLVIDKDYLFDEDCVDDVMRCLKPLVKRRKDIKIKTAEIVESNKVLLKTCSLPEVEKLIEAEYRHLEGIDG